MEISLAQRIFKTNKSFVLFHTHSATHEAIKHAIMSGKSMDLDICVDDLGNPYLGHSKEYYEKSGETQPETMAFWEAIELVSKAGIPVIVDCKHYDAWPIVEKVIDKIGAHRCLVHSFATELKFDYEHNDHDYLTEWSPIKKITEIKSKFPFATITASCKFLPNDLLLSAQYEKLLSNIRKTLKDNGIDTVCLNVPDNTMSDKILEFFLKEKILTHVGIDNVDISKLSKIYVGETDNLPVASDCKLIEY
ncbi:hypothetical protein KKG29_02995 [Patescibacteria group bacterium]|nr:hypothetical protein [Patescibacteria group bacterium]MBU4000116.1 hypothetical protein [Patescibacteria group bacterium]MBU4368987.1 hypothetical protein [Patescibacteria group bacterium]